MIEHLHDRMTEIEQARRRLHDLAHPDPVSLLLTYAHHEEIREQAGRLAELAGRMAGGEYRPPYNGWPNRETWNAALWIGNDEASQDHAREIVAGALARIPDHWKAEPTPYPPDIARAVLAGQIRQAADELREWFEEEHGPDDTASPLSDAWTYAMAVVDWYHIAEGMAEELAP